MSTFGIFHQDNIDLRAGIDENGQSWFAASDVAAALGYSATAAMTRSMDDDEKGVRTLHTLGGDQEMTTITEAGLYSAIVRSTIPAAREFRRWVTHEVLPSIRRTGSYTVPAEDDALLVARALQASARMLEAKDAEIAVLTPKADAWDELASAEGDYDVADAAKILARAGVQTGRQRLFDQLSSISWIFRAPNGKWKAYQAAVDAGYLAERPQSHHHPRTGELVIDMPQVRVTLRGIERLRVRLGTITAPALRIVEGNAS